MTNELNEFLEKEIKGLLSEGLYLYLKKSIDIERQNAILDHTLNMIKRERIK